MSNAQHDRRIDYIEFSVKSVPEAKRFYGSAFGWSFEDYGPDYAAFDDGRTTGGFFQSEKTVGVDAGSPLIVFYREALEETRDKVTALGGRIIRDIFDFPGGRRFHFADPGEGEFAIWSDK